MTSADRPRRRRKCAESSPSGSQARRSSVLVASASAGFSSSVPRGRERRCSPRRSRPGSTRRSSRYPDPASQRPSSVSTPSSFASSPGARRSSRASGAASASSSSTRSTRSGRGVRRCSSPAPIELYSWIDPSDFSFYGPWGARNPSGDLIIESRRWRERLFEARAPERRPNPMACKDRRARQPVPRRHARRHGRRRPACTQPAARRHGWNRQPAVHAQGADEPHQHTPGRLIHRPAPARQGRAAHPGRAAAQRADLLHRSDERPARRARPGTDPAWPHGSSRAVPYADQGRPQGRVRPLPQQGLARTRPRHAEAPRRDRPDHERLLAGDDRPDLLDGADECPA